MVPTSACARAAAAPLALLIALGPAAAQNAPAEPAAQVQTAPAPATPPVPAPLPVPVQVAPASAQKEAEPAPRKAEAQARDANRKAESAPQKPAEAQPKDGVQKDAAQKEAQRKKEPAPLVYAKVSADPTPTLNPRTFLDTLRAAERYQAFAEAGGWEPLPADLVLKPGASNPAVPSLRHHLTLTGDLPADAPPSDRLDPPLIAAITAFQARHGLPETGSSAARPSRP